MAEHRTEPLPETVPLFGSWTNAYRAVIAVLVADILILYGCTRLFS